jgi:uncharacterized protein (TIGR03000 family)
MKTLRLVPAAAVAAALLAAAWAARAPAQPNPGGLPITIRLLVPGDARVEFDGEKTTLTGTEREYVTPPVPAGRDYGYDLRVTAGGKSVGRRITVRPGAVNAFDLRADFRAGAAEEKGGAVTEEEAFEIGARAYIYGYPLVTMEMTRRVMTNTAEPKGPHAPMGQFANMREYPTAAFKDITAPNADTLYSVAWLDVSKEPYVLSLPDEGDRYYMMPMLSGWTDVFQSPGTRTTGDKPQKYAITGPNWKGALPEGVTEYRSSTNLVWIIGRTYCTGTPEDYKAVHALQDKYSLVPLSAYGKEYRPPAGKVDPDVDMKTPVREQVNKMDAAAYFTLLARLLKDNPPSKEDGPMVAKLARIGIVPGQDFDFAKLDAAVQKGLERGRKAGLEQIVSEVKHAGKRVNGWQITYTGEYGTRYLFRAAVAFMGLGANRAKDAVYPMTDMDAAGKPLKGANKYEMTFAKGQTPPVKGFWSLTMYDAEYRFVANPLNRYALSPRDKLQANPDGSVTLYLQHDSPGKEKEGNWLPAPEGDFVLVLRLYWPEEAVLDGKWQPPVVKRVK